MKVMATLKTPFVHVAVFGPVNPPVNETGRPFSHVPVKVTPERAIVPAAGPVILTFGAVLSRMNVRVSLPERRAASV